MTWLLPHPVVSAALLVLWLLLNVTISIGHILLGSALGLAGGWALHALRPPKARVGRAGAILRLVSRVFADILWSNVAVARIVLGLGGRERTSGFVNIPLDLRDPYGLAALACIITSTPGTLWVKHDPTTGMLTIHVLDLIDEGDWFRTIKGRYERLLLEIFE
jgi:multicomponent K+:H+ antiporter subunit E